MTLTYPLGLLALLGIPAIIAIHFLQRQSQTVMVSTLFLLDQMRRESVSGRRFERIRNSIPLWLQLLMVLLLTWLLVAPQWTRPSSVQQIAVILDSSASMSAFRDEVKTNLLSELTRLSEATARTEFVILDSRIAEEPIFSGTELDTLPHTMEESWQPHGGEHDFGPALRIGRSLVGANGLLILATDHVQGSLAYNATQLSIGSARANVGFAGVSTEFDDAGDLRWKATLRNYSPDTPQTRTWYLSTDQQARSDDRSITLEPGEIRSLQGLFPPSANALTLNLAPDEFSLDDTLPVLRPEPKPFYVGRVASARLDESFRAIIESFGENVSPPIEEVPTDLMLATFDPISPDNVVPPSAFVFLQQRSTPRKFLSGRIASANHPLINDLNWQGLIARESPEIPNDGVLDTPLLWQGDRTLIFLRTSEGRRQMVFNFDLATSNATNLPAFVVLLHRFVERLRDAKVAPEALNLEIHQAIDLARNRQSTDPEGNARDLSLSQVFTPTKGGPQTSIIPANQADLLRAPDLPGFLEIRQGETSLLRAATHFADTREADLSEAAEANDLPSTNDHLVQKNATAQTPWQILLIGLLLVLMASWFFVNRKPVVAPSST